MRQLEINTMSNWRLAIYNVIDENNKDTWLARAFDVFIVGLIIANVVAIVLGSFKGINAVYGPALHIFEYFSVAIFTAEYLARILTADIKYAHHSRLGALLLYVISPMALVDLLAILPTYLPMLIAIDLRFIRALRLLRLLRLFKLNRYSTSMQLFIDVFKEKRADLYVTLFVTLILLVVASTLMYHVEGPVQPDVFPNIAAAFWWAIATLTTVGYGDAVPVTVLGKIISGGIALLGIGLVALPTGIVSSAFVQKLTEKKKEPEFDGAVCPTCGKPKGHVH